MTSPIKPKAAREGPIPVAVMPPIAKSANPPDIQ